MPNVAPVPVDQLDLPFLELQSPDYLEDPVAHVQAIRGDHRLARSDRGIEVLAYDWVNELLRDRRVLHIRRAAAGGVQPPTVVAEFQENGLLVSMEGEQHQRLKQMLLTGFSKDRVESVRPMIRDIADELIDRFADNGQCDAVDDFSHHLSINSISRFIGVPAPDVPLFDRLTTTFHLMHVPAAADRVAAAFEQLFEYVSDLTRRRAAEPQNDFVSWLTQEQGVEGRLNEAELVWSIANILMAGHETTRWSIASAVRALAEHEGVLTALREDDSLIPETVDEVIRFYPAVICLPPRMAEQDDLVLGDTLLPARTVVNLNMIGAGRDPQRFADPERFDLRRGYFPVAFGLGPHLCLGHRLARMEIEEALRAFTRRFKAVEPAGPVEFTPNFALLRGPERVPIKLKTT